MKTNPISNKKISIFWNQSDDQQDYFNRSIQRNNALNNKCYKNIYLGDDIEDNFKEKQTIIMNEQTPILLKLLQNDSFESGYESSAQRYFNLLYEKYGLIADTILLNIYLQNMYDNIYVVKHILFIIAELPKERRNNLEFIPLAGVSNPELEVQDLSVECLEKWGDKKHIPTLEKIKNDTSVIWFKEYIAEVIESLKEE